MGGFKHLIEIDRTEGGATARRPLLGHVLATAARTRHAGITCVLASGDARGAELAAAFEISVVHALPRGEGRAASVRAGVRAAPDARGWLFLMADQPFLTTDDLAHLSAAWAGDADRIIRASYAGQGGTPAIFGQRYRDALLALRGGEGGRVILARHPEAIVDVPLSPARGHDLDTRNDLPADATLPMERDLPSR
jgi:molybdenum cofactor cytidylyltransferase